MSILALSGCTSSVKQSRVRHIHADCGTILTCLTITQRPVGAVRRSTYGSATSLRHLMSANSPCEMSEPASLRAYLGGG